MQANVCSVTCAGPANLSRPNEDHPARDTINEVNDKCLRSEERLPRFLSAFLFT